MGIKRAFVHLGAAVAVAGFAPVQAAEAPPENAAKAERVSSELLEIYAAKYSSPAAERHVCSDRDRAQTDLHSSVLVDATAKNDAELLLSQLTEIGLKFANVAAPVVSGYLPICAIAELDGCCSELRFIRKATALTQAQ
jgi:hypothetical protein